MASLRRSTIVLRIALAACLALAMLGGGASAGSPPLIAQPGVTAPASIPELARALKYDAKLIFEYVYTNIEYSPTWGVKKGALGTLLDGSGNDFDQSALLVALLRASGYTASYAFGTININAERAVAFYGVEIGNSCPLNSLLAAGGFDGFSFDPDCASKPFEAKDVPHVWVQATGGSLGSTTYALDPSYKTYSTAAGYGNLGSIVGYNQSTFLTAAKSGATINGNTSIQNLNSANIASSLTTYANNLVGYIRSRSQPPTTRDVIGGSYISPLPQDFAFPTRPPYEPEGETPEVWTGDIPNEYRTTLRLQIGGIDKTYFADSIYGHRLSIVYDGSRQPVLYRDGLAQATGAIDATTISFSVSFPFCLKAAGPQGDCETGYTHIYSSENVLKAISTYTYAIVAGWDFTGRGMVEFHRRQLQANRAEGHAESSEAVLGEALNMIGYSWLAQASASTAITDRMAGTKFVTHSAVGIAGQVGGPYVDVPGSFVAGTSLKVDVPNERVEKAFFTDGGNGSAFEWGTLEQNFAQDGVGAVSTVNLLDIANTQGEVIYNADSTNWTTVVKPQLVNYTVSDLSSIESYINLGYRFVLPRNGNFTVGAWFGSGYIRIAPPTDGIRLLGYIISSNLKGGYTTEDLVPEETVRDVSVNSPYIFPLPQFYSYDPFDLSSGAFHYDREDLSLGSADFPVGLAFRRSYNSNNLYTKGPLGPGWSHSRSPRSPTATA